MCLHRFPSFVFFSEKDVVLKGQFSSSGPTEPGGQGAFAIPPNVLAELEAKPGLLRDHVLQIASPDFQTFRQFSSRPAKEQPWLLLGAVFQKNLCIEGRLL